MQQVGLPGTVQGRRCRTIVPAVSTSRPTGLVRRVFRRDTSNALWVADLTYVATWDEVVYVVFGIDAFAIVSERTKATSSQ